MSRQVTIQAGQSLSSIFQPTGNCIGIIVPAATSAALSFQVSMNGGSFYTLKDSTGTEVSIPASTHNCAYALPLELFAWDFFKILSGTSGAVINQAGTLVIDIIQNE